MTTVADPLSAGLMIISVRARSWVRAHRSDGVRLSFPLVDLARSKASSSTAFMYVSRAGYLFFGRFQVLFFLKRCCSGSYCSSGSSGS